MSQQPEEIGTWEFSITKPTGTSISFTVYASETGDFMGEEIYLGEAGNGSSVTTRTRWYKVVAKLYPNEVRTATPKIDKIKVVFPNG
jgi:hypothetical protein